MMISSVGIIRICLRFIRLVSRDRDRQIGSFPDKNEWAFRPVFVNTTLKYCKILTIDQAKQTATMIIDYQTEWLDPRLKWNPANYSDIRAFTVAKEDTVWLPDALPFDT